MQLQWSLTAISCGFPWSVNVPLSSPTPLHPTSDFKLHVQREIDILGFNLPSGAAFGGAFVLGLRWG